MRQWRIGNSLHLLLSVGGPKHHMTVYGLYVKVAMHGNWTCIFQKIMRIENTINKLWLVLLFNWDSLFEDQWASQHKSDELILVGLRIFRFISIQPDWHRWAISWMLDSPIRDLAPMLPILPGRREGFHGHFGLCICRTVGRNSQFMPPKEWLGTSLVIYFLANRKTYNPNLTGKDLDSLYWNFNPLCFPQVR